VLDTIDMPLIAPLLSDISNVSDICVSTWFNNDDLMVNNHV
jgi:hypothetical protein